MIRIVCCIRTIDTTNNSPMTARLAGKDVEIEVKQETGIGVLKSLSGLFHSLSTRLTSGARSSVRLGGR